ncbi:MAG: glyoxalase superfamily protein [Rubricella sp.]
MRPDLPTLAEAKAAARRLRADLAGKGQGISHAQALERIAHAHGFRDWNGLHAAIRQGSPPGWIAGARVSGRYLSQPFAATILSAEEVRPGWTRLVLDLDTAVDVVRFESFSNRRKRVQGVVGPLGESLERTSDGVPHLVVHAKPGGA